MTYLFGLVGKVSKSRFHCYGSSFELARANLFDPPLLFHNDPTVRSQFWRAEIKTGHNSFYDLSAGMLGIDSILSVAIPFAYL